MKPVLSFGRIMLGLAYVVYGYLHFAHTAADAAMVPQGVGRPVVWVILIGICWWAVALSFFTNILTRLSGVLASVLLFFVLFFVKEKPGVVLVQLPGRICSAAPVLQAVQSIAPRPDCICPGVRHSATAEILTQQITENVSHILCTSLLFCNKPM